MWSGVQVSVVFRFIVLCSGVSQLFSEGRQVFGKLGQAKIRTVNHICFTATFGWTNRFAVTLVAQMPVFSTCTHRNVSVSCAMGQSWLRTGHRQKESPGIRYCSLAAMKRENRWKWIMTYLDAGR